ncbi:LysR family transcriptional regulator [Bordetella genomosp. 8]|uniref:LysR family transcriptional regulator n=1 Tax=Bordetella genomosp. 8 TaxID=1416806 RepID=A0A1W6YFD6_9BORD|nr:LysR substrate-binding domain-containing protein [Bordetella genomosp. 8]ARP79787.1 LysR family transcriptional regulator [Bordetella genomosp. 8]
MLNVRHLEIFRAVVQTGSVSAAGRMLYISQPAVTKTLRLLEGELGLTLFQRVKGRLVCTPEADALMPEVERLFGSVESVRQAALEIRQGVRGRITVASVSALSMSVVAQAVNAFHQLHPQVQFDVRALPTRHVVEYVGTSQVDMGIIDVPTPVATLEVEEICKSEVVCVLHRDHPLARYARLTPEHLADWPIITFADDTFTGFRLREAFRERGVPYDTALVSNSTGTLCAMVQALNAVALVDHFILMTSAFPHLVMRRFSPRIDMQPRFLFSPMRPRSAIVAQFADAIRTAARTAVRRLSRPGKQA